MERQELAEAALQGAQGSVDVAVRELRAAARHLKPPALSPTKLEAYAKRDDAVAAVLAEYQTVTTGLVMQQTGLTPRSARAALQSLAEAGRAEQVDEKHFKSSD